MATDLFANSTRPGALQDPLSKVADGAVVRNDAADLPFRPRAIHVSVAGNIKYTAGTPAVTPPIEAFEVGWHPIRPDRIFATGTTATFTIWT